MAASTPTLNPLFPTTTKTNHPRDTNPSPLLLLRKCKSLRQLKQIQAATIKSNLQHDISVLAKLISFCTLNPSTTMDHAQLLFDQIPQPDIVVFNTMARGYALTDDPIRAFTLFSDVLSMGVHPDDYTFPSLLKACANSKALDEGKQVHSLVFKLGLHDNIYVHPTLINMYTECGEIRSARLVFDKILNPCVVCYNSMITGYTRCSQPNKALELFRELQASNLNPTDVTMLSVVSSCALLGALELGKWIHEYIKKNGFDEYLKVNTAVIDMYAKCGSLEDAVGVFENMRFRDTQAWSTMIIAYAIHGHGHKAISLFEDMKRARVRPDGITFLGVLYACSHAGMVVEGCEYYESMRARYGVVPGIKHYGCMVDLLGRAGRLDEAYKFIEELPVRPTAILWRTLLSACSIHENVELGKHVIERIFELDNSHGGDYVILSNMLARNGRWEDVNNIRTLMKERGVVKVPGCSSVEVDNIVHEFFSGDGTHPEFRELHKKLDDLVKELKLVGYVPDTSLVVHADMREEEKEASLRYHSEKLAISYGLINTAPWTTIRVVKNLRVCGDCHSAAKLISLISKRKVILRDIQRFHHFEDGECSCGDYW